MFMRLCRAAIPNCYRTGSRRLGNQSLDLLCALGVFNRVGRAGPGVGNFIQEATSDDMDRETRF